MKAIKKRSKALLFNLKQSAEALQLVCADLSVLSEIQQLAGTILIHVDALNLLMIDVKKTELKYTLSSSPAWTYLETLLDNDVISNLEEQFFKLLDNNAEQPVGVFFQELLAKIDTRYNDIINIIQDISELLAEDD